MSIITFSSREFNQYVSKAKRAAARGPVFITGRSYIEHVLLTIQEYQKLTDKKESIVELLSMPDICNGFRAAPFKHKTLSTRAGSSLTVVIRNVKDFETTSLTPIAADITL